MIKPDKKLHFAGNVALFVLGAIVAHSQGGGITAQLAAGFILAMTVSIAKEVIHDLVLKRGTPSWGDMLANVVGQAVGAGVVWLAWLPTS